MRSKRYGKVGPDVDLDREVVRLPSGERLTRQRANEIAAEITGRPLGRPSLSGHRKPSPAVSFRVDPDTLARVQAEAEREGVTVSQLARHALDEFLAAR
ncbi:ribbon-helix-helix protein, CopG family [Nakamurella lactea]|uniref:ribbon-helix-helix protein, CopG family n=1 Tax=Nakamurella lactea TaxID=459515 RepID=UPI0012B62CF2|nr:ribbon-helix-helix protein, CopG family [Nakamurella lactea]